LNSKISDKDKEDWQKFISNKDRLPNKDEKITENKITKSFTFDLHGYSLNDANKKIEELIQNAYNLSINKLIIVTGKGLHSKNEKDPYVSKDLGILRYSVPEYIKNNKSLRNMINEVREASIDEGGSGAFYIFLKKKL
tara:strand:- start:1362 stop:1775 length:414 start_codon:yes stop_codon:yes gene_type:complete